MLKSGHKKKDIIKALGIAESTLYREVSKRLKSH